MNENDDIVALGVAGLAARYRDGSLSPTVAIEFYLSKIVLLNPRINAVLDIYAKEAHESAQASAQRYKSGKPLSEIDGVPIGIKANIAAKGHVCHGGIKAYENSVATEDSDVVARLREAGAIILGSLNMEEGALGAATDNPWFGKTHNPLKHGYTPGGSSGGSAAAVAAGMMPAALGTDTMGSVRIPSAYCGLTGHKPTNGLVPMDGVMPLSPTLDCVGPHTRNVQDTRLILSVLTGKSVNEQPININTLVIGVLDFGDDVDVTSAVQAGFDGVGKTLDGKGVETLKIAFDGYDFGKSRRAGLLVSEVEGSEIHAQQLSNNPDGFSKHLRALLSWGTKQSREKIDAAYELISAQSSRAERIFNQCNVLIAPTAPQQAFKFGDPIPANQADFTAFANFAGLPATAVPVHGDGLPASVQIIGPKGKDSLTLAVAEQLMKLI